MIKVSLPTQLLIILGSVILFGNMLTTSTIQLFYSISLTFKECLSFLLPYMVFAFISSGILAFKKRAPIVIGVLLTCILLSNSLVALFAYIVSTSLLCSITNGVVIDQLLTTQAPITPLWLFSLPKFISSEKAMLSAVIVGMILSYINVPLAEQAIARFKKNIEWLLNSFFIPILPIYILGFLLEIHHKGVFLQLFQSYGKTFALIFVLHMITIFIIYFIASGFKLQKALTYINNAIPSYLTAFGTMSSTATIPVTIQCAQKNIDNQPLTQVATPILANVHLLGDAISTPILAIVTLYLFTGIVPSAVTFCSFIMYFCLTMLAVSGVPGGGIIVMIPILTAILGFSDAMISIITTLYLLQDAIGTAANVMGDGALIIIVDKVLKKIGIR